MTSVWLKSYTLIFVIILSLSMTACVQPMAMTSSKVGANRQLTQLVGSWQVETTVVQQNTTFPALFTFTSDGMVITDETPSPFETSGHGNWVTTGRDTADFTFLALIGSAEGPLSSTIKVVGSVNYDSNDDTWEGPFSIHVTDAKGAEILADQGTFKGTRIAVEKAEVASQSLKPGDKIGNMRVVQGPDPFDLNIPPNIAFCNANPDLEPGSTVSKPGVYTVECAVPPLKQMIIGFGWVTNNQQLLNDQWSAISTELYVNGQKVDQAAFGSLDADVPLNAASAGDASNVINVKLRIWNVALENLTPGPLELRYVRKVDRELVDEMTTTPKGIYDITYKITVDASLVVVEGTPAPIELVQQSSAVFDLFNAAVNAHDVDKAITFFAEDATVQFPNIAPPTVYTGLAEIRTWLESEAKDNTHVETENVQASGDTLSALVKVHGDSLPPDLVLSGTVEVTVKNGKITAFSYTLNDETLVKLQSPQPPVSVEFVYKIDTTVQTTMTGGMTVDSAGNLYIADRGETYRILKYDRQGHFVLAWGSQGSGKGQFEFRPPSPDAGPDAGFVATDAQGNVYVSDAYNFRVQKFDADGKFLMQFGSQGVDEGQFDPPSTGPIYVDNDGNIYVSTFSRVQKFDPSGKFLAAYGTTGSGEGEFNGAAFGTLDSEGNLYIADLLNARVQKFDPNGKFLLQWGRSGTEPGQFNMPVTVNIDHQNRLYVADNSARIQLFTTDGEFLGQWITIEGGNPPAGGLMDVYVDRQDTIYISDIESIYVYHLSGQ